MRRSLPLCILGLALVLAACATPGGRTPEVMEIVEAWNADLGPRPDRDTLASGRAIYMTSCARCHTPQPVTRYDADTWQKMLPGMVDDAKLDLAEEDALRAYLEAALAVGGNQETNGKSGAQ